MKVIGANAALDYRKPMPTRLRNQFDVVFDTHGGLTLSEGRALVRSGGLILDINPLPAQMLPLILSRRRRFIMAKQDEATFRDVAALAGAGGLKITIGRIVPLVDGVTSRFVRQTTICRTLWEHRRQAATRRYWYRVSRLIPRSRAMVALRSPAAIRRSSSATLSSERDRFRPR